MNRLRLALARLARKGLEDNPLMVPESADEQEGQVDQVVSAEGPVQYKVRRCIPSLTALLMD